MKLLLVTVSQCPTNCHLHGDLCIKKLSILSRSTASLNSQVCGNLKRKGHLCGDCMKGFGFPIYSYSLNCVRYNKTDFVKSVIKYVSCAYLPLTIFYISTIALKFTITSHKMSAFVFVCQILTIPSALKIVLSLQDSLSIIHYAFGAVTVWNLDIFRSILKPFCLHANLNLYM